MSERNWVAKNDFNRASTHSSAKDYKRESFTVADAENELKDFYEEDEVISTCAIEEQNWEEYLSSLDCELDDSSQKYT